MTEQEVHDIWIKDLFDTPVHPRDFAAVNEIKALREKVAELEKKLATKEKKATTK